MLKKKVVRGDILVMFLIIEEIIQLFTNNYDFICGIAIHSLFMLRCISLIAILLKLFINKTKHLT